MKKLIYLFALSIGAMGCSVDSLDSETLTVADLSAKGKNEVSVETTLDPMKFYTGNGKNIAGSLSIWNDCDNLYIQILPADGKENPEEVLLGIFADSDLPMTSGDSGNIKTDDFLTLLDSENLIWISALGDATSFNIFIKAYGHWAGNTSADKIDQNFNVYNVEEIECAPVCAYGKGYWENHGPNNEPGNQENMYPVEQLIIAGTTYSQVEIQQFLKKTGGTTKLHKMSQHLIAVLLNIANGVDGSEIQNTISTAEELIRSNSADEQLIDNVKKALEQFNKDNACDDADEYEEVEE